MVPLNPNLRHELEEGVREALGTTTASDGDESDGSERKTAPLKVVGTRARKSFEALFSRR